MSFSVINHSRPERGYFVYAKSGLPLPGFGGFYSAASAPVNDDTAIRAVANPGYMFTEWMGVVNFTGQWSPWLQLMNGYPV
jgi:hypothetical protein